MQRECVTLLKKAEEEKNMRTKALDLEPRLEDVSCLYVN